MLISPGSTGAPVDVAFRLDLSFSLSEAMTETRPLRFLIVSSDLAFVFSSRSYVCASAGDSVETTRRTVGMMDRSARLRKSQLVLQNIATDLACARDSWSS